MSSLGSTKGSQYKYLIVFAVLISYGSLYPFDFSAAPSGAFWRLFSEASIFGSVGDTLGNIGLFVPWGIAGILIIAPRRGMALAIAQTFAIGFVIALGLQIAQLWVPTRTSALSDVLWNMVGCAVGFLLGNRLLAHDQNLSGILNFQQTSGYFLAAWITLEWLPLIPSFDFQLIKDNVKNLLAFRSISFSLVFERVAITLLLGELLNWHFKPRHTLILLPLLILFVIFAKIFLVDVQLDASLIVGFALGVMSWWTLYKLSSDRRTAAIVVVLLLAYSIQALTPFSLKNVPSSFGWLPFEGLLEGSMLVNIRSLGSNLLLFGGVLLLLRNAGSNIVVTSVVIALWVMGMELAQLFITGRSGSITEPLLVLISGQFIGELDFSKKNGTFKNKLTHDAEKLTTSVNEKYSLLTRRGAVLQIAISVAVIVISLKILLELPEIPYNVKELFRADGSILALTSFALSLLWIGAGSIWLGHRLIQSRSPGLQLFPLTIAVSLISLALLWSGVTSESVSDIVGSSNRFWFVTNKNVWGDFWRDVFLYLDTPEAIGFLETCTRYWALYTPPIICLALIVYFKTPRNRQQQANRTKSGLVLVAFLIMWLCKAIAFDWSSTDNLNELIAYEGKWGWGGGGYLYGLMFLICMNAILLAEISIANTRSLITAAIFSLMAIPLGWLLINQGLEQYILKYDAVYSGVQFLLGPDRNNLLSHNELLIRWCLVQMAGVVILALGARLGKNIFPFSGRTKFELTGTKPYSLR